MEILVLFGWWMVDGGWWPIFLSSKFVHTNYIYNSCQRQCVNKVHVYKRNPSWTKVLWVLIFSEVGGWGTNSKITMCITISGFFPVLLFSQCWVNFWYLCLKKKMKDLIFKQAGPEAWNLAAGHQTATYWKSQINSPKRLEYCVLEYWLL